jgi:hypothetical protein
MGSDLGSRVAPLGSESIRDQLVTRSPRKNSSPRTPDWQGLYTRRVPAASTVANATGSSTPPPGPSCRRARPSCSWPTTPSGATRPASSPCTTSCASTRTVGSSSSDPPRSGRGRRHRAARPEAGAAGLGDIRGDRRPSEVDPLRRARCSSHFEQSAHAGFVDEAGDSRRTVSAERRSGDRQLLLSNRTTRRPV